MSNNVCKSNFYKSVKSQKAKLFMLFILFIIGALSYIYNSSNFNFIGTRSLEAQQYYQRIIPKRINAPLDEYEVVSGDTLWDICEKLLGDASLWPQIWSYNPQITNAHWIYPGDSIRFYPVSYQPVQKPLQPLEPLQALQAEQGMPLAKASHSNHSSYILKRMATTVNYAGYNSGLTNHNTQVKGEVIGSTEGRLLSSYKHLVLIKTNQGLESGQTLYTMRAVNHLNLSKQNNRKFKRSPYYFKTLKKLKKEKTLKNNSSADLNRATIYEYSGRLSILKPVAVNANTKNNTKNTEQKEYYYYKALVENLDGEVMKGDLITLEKPKKIKIMNAHLDTAGQSLKNYSAISILGGEYPEYEIFGEWMLVYFLDNNHEVNINKPFSIDYDDFLEISNTDKTKMPVVNHGENEYRQNIIKILPLYRDKKNLDLYTGLVLNSIKEGEAIYNN